MGSKLDELPPARPEQSESPFNIYNTEIIRFDATNATQMANGDLVASADGSNEHQDDKFVLLKADYELADHLIQTDSVNVRILFQLKVDTHLDITYNYSSRQYRI